MVTMVLLPQPSNCSLQLQVDEQNNNLLLEPYNVVTTSSSLIDYFTRKEVAPKRREFPVAVSVMRCVCCCLLGSWTKLAWSGATWTLLMCLLLARGRTDRRLEDSDQSSTSAVPGPQGALSSLRLDGVLTFSNTTSAASDFGRIRFALPSAILYPRSVRDIQVTVRAVHRAPASSGLTMAAKGRAHSVHGQAQVLYVYCTPLTLIARQLQGSFTSILFPFSLHSLVCISRGHVVTFRRWLESNLGLGFMILTS